MQAYYELTPNKAVIESWFKGSFLFDIVALSCCKELLYNSTLMCQMMFSKGSCNKFKFPQ